MAVKTKKKNSYKSYECEICGKVLKTSFPSIIQSHMQIHNDSKPFQCEICDKRFKRKGELKMHRQGIHSGDKKLKCEFCKKQFKTSAELKRQLSSQQA